MVKEDIETVIDRLLDYVHRAGKVPLGDAASAVGRPANQVERLALLLEEKGLLEVHYDITGVKIAAPKPEESGQPDGKGKPDSPNAPSGVLDESRELEHEVLTSESLLKFFEKDLERRVIRAEKMLELLEKSDYTKHELEETTKEIELAIRQLEAFEKEISSLTLKSDSLRLKLVGFRQKLSKVKPIEPAKQPVSAPLKNKIAKIIAEIMAFLEFVKADLRRMLQKPAKKPLPKIPPAQASKHAEQSKREQYAPIAVAVPSKPIKLEKAHKVQLIRSSSPVITTASQEKSLVSAPFVQRAANAGAGKNEADKGPRPEMQLARAVESLERIAQKVVGSGRATKGQKTAVKKKSVKAAATRKKSKRALKPAVNPSMKKTAKKSSRKLVGKKIRVLEVRKDGLKEHYWVRRKKK